MKVDQYFRSLAAEMAALKDRVRQLIDTRHWQTDGEWKEPVLRQILRRNLPETVHVGRGFVVAPGWASAQIDVLITDASKPVLFRDGDLAIVTADAVLGVVEVKSRATPGIIRNAIGKLAQDMGSIRRHPNSKAFAAILAFEAGTGKTSSHLNDLATRCKVWDERIDALCLGPSKYIQYWDCEPNDERRARQAWHAYALPDTAFGYLINNIVEAVTPHSVGTNRGLWFPIEGKEVFIEGHRAAAWHVLEHPEHAG